jgi:uridine kinase
VVTERMTVILYRRTNRHGRQHRAISQRLNERGLKTLYVVTDWPRVVDLSGGPSKTLARRSWPP